MSNLDQTAVEKRRAEFRELHKDGFFVLPNPWDVGSARTLAAMGFRALASTSSGAAWAMGKSDYELTLDQVLDHLRVLQAATDLPINADFENGFADLPAEVAANVRLAAQTGVAAVSIEDRVGNALYPFQLAVQRVAAARTALRKVAPSAMLVARTEMYLLDDVRPHEAIERLMAFAEVGADCLYAPGMCEVDDIGALVRKVAPLPVNVLYRSGMDIAALAQLGVRRLSTGGFLARAAESALRQEATKFLALPS